jgi:tetratricopeptide (TPR) repeat protein
MRNLRYFVITILLISGVVFFSGCGQSQEESKGLQTNDEARKLYLRGRDLLDQRGPGDDVQRAVEYFEKALEKDPDFILPYTDLVLSYVWLGPLGGVMPLDESERKGRAAAEKALELNDKLSDAHVAMGLVREFFDFDWAGAEESFKRAIELNPKSKEGHFEHGWLLIRLGRFDEAKQRFETHRKLEQEISSLSEVAFVSLSIQSRQYDSAIQLCNKAIERDSTAAMYFDILALVYSEKGEHEQAMASLEKYTIIAGAPSWWAGYYYAVAGKRDKAMAALDDLQKGWQSENVGAQIIAAIHAGLGEKQEALTWLGRVYEKQPGQLVHLKTDPTWDSLRDEPGFKALLKKINLE